jgi:hypothetical protein
MRKLILLSLLAWIGSIYSVPIQIPSNLAASDAPSLLKDLKEEYPFPTEATFIKFSDHFISCISGSIDPEQIKLGDTVYVMDWYLSWFLENVHPKIKDPYILISGDTDGAHPDPGSKIALYDPKIAAWFCKNMDLSNHPKIIAIPIGQSILQWQGSFTHACREELLQLAKTSLINKFDYPLVYSNFNPVNDLSRYYVLKLFSEKPFCFSEGLCSGGHHLLRQDYWKQYSKFKFVLAPRGQGTDTCRFWEALCLNVIPILEHSTLDELYEGTPCLIVKSWDDVTEEMLLEKYDEIQRKLERNELSTEKAYFDYWTNRISQIQKLLRQDHWPNHHLEKTLFDDSSISTLKQILGHASYKNALLLIYGQAVGLRAYQLANAFPNFDTVLVADKFGFGAEQSIKLAPFLKNESFELNQKTEFTSEVFFPEIITRHTHVAMFMDLTYQRYKFTDKLLEIYKLAPKNTLISGNMATDPYVKNLLIDVASIIQTSLNQNEDFWYFIKKQ